MIQKLTIPLLFLFLHTILIAQENTPLLCSDGIDNDGDGLIDCDDPQCDNLPNQGCTTCFNNGLSFADVVLDFNPTCLDNNLFADASEALGVSNYPGTPASGRFVSLGDGGTIYLGFTNNILTNSGDAVPDLIVFEVGPAVEDCYIELLPLDTETQEELINAGILDTDNDGYFDFGTIQGTTSTVDIDALASGFSNGDLKFAAIKITDVLDAGCLSDYPGADIDAVCALSSIASSCPDLTSELTINCGPMWSTFIWKVCNIGDETAVSYRATLYIGNPTLEDAEIEFISSWSFNLDSMECETVTMQVPNPTETTTYYLVANDDGSGNLPYDFETDFPLTNLIECDYTNNMSSATLVIEPTPAIDLGADTILCGNNNSLLLDAGDEHTSYLWQDGSTQSTLLATQSGLYWVEVPDICDEVKRDSIIVTFDELPPIGLQNTYSICNGDSLFLSVTGYDTYLWLPNENIDCNTCNEVFIYPNTSMAYTLVASTQNACTATATFVVSVTEFFETQLDTILCGESSIIFDGVEVAVNTSMEFVHPSVMDCDTLITVNVIAGDGPYVELIDTLICEGTSFIFNDVVFDNQIDTTFFFQTVDACDSLIQVVVGFIGEVDSLTQTNFLLNSDTTLCEGESISLLIETIANTTYEWLTPQGELIVGEALFLENISSDNVGTYYVTAYHSDCPTGIDSLEIGIEFPPQNPNLGADTFLCLSENETLNIASNIEADAFQWNTGATSSNILINTPGLYSLTVINECGMTTDSILVEDFCGCHIFFPNIFSPNDDGINDTFYPFYDCPFMDYNLKIFDRWGELVFESFDSKQEWHGFFREKAMHQGVYVWLCEYSNQEGAFLLYGDVTLIR